MNKPIRLTSGYRPEPRSPIGRFIAVILSVAALSVGLTVSWPQIAKSISFPNPPVGAIGTTYPEGADSAVAGQWDPFTVDNATGGVKVLLVGGGSFTIGNVNQTQGTAGFEKITDGTNNAAVNAAESALNAHVTNFPASQNTGEFLTSPPTITNATFTPLMTDNKGFLLLSPQSTVATAQFNTSFPTLSSGTLAPISADPQGRAYLSTASRVPANTSTILTPASTQTCTAINANATYLGQVINASAAAETAELKIFNNSGCTAATKIYDATLSISSSPFVEIPLTAQNGLWYTLSAAPSDNIVITYTVPTNS